MGIFGVILFIAALVAIFAMDVFSVSYLKTALLDLRMRKPGFFLGSAGICLVSIALSLIMAGAFLESPVKADADTVEVPKAGVVVEDKTEEKAEESKAEKIKAGATEVEETKAEAPESKEPESKQPEAKQPEVAAPAPVVQPKTEVKSALVPSFEVWKGYYKGFSYNFIDIKNGTPYVYMPASRGNFQSDLNNIVNNREGGNIVVMANAGIFDMTTIEPLGVTIQNSKIVAENTASNSNWTLVVDENGNVGYVQGAVKGTTTDYIDARTGKTVKNRKIVSAVYAFVPFVLNNEAQESFRSAYQNAYRARQIFCVKQDSYIIITNTGEGETGGGWNFDDMAQVAEYRGCISAFNLDGGGSTATAYRTTLNRGFTIYATTLRRDPTFIVFTADNLAPRGK